jgi:hypothetical protein
MAGLVRQVLLATLGPGLDVGFAASNVAFTPVECSLALSPLGGVVHESIKEFSTLVAVSSLATPGVATHIFIIVTVTSHSSLFTLITAGEDVPATLFVCLEVILQWCDL